MAAAGRGSGTAESMAARLKRKYAANATKTHNTRARSQTHARSAAHNLGEAAAEMSEPYVTVTRANIRVAVERSICMYGVFVA